MRTPTLGARAFIPVALTGAVLLSLAPGAAGTAAAADPSRTEGEQIVRIAKAQRGDPWRYGATGPRSFDCSGLVIYAYKQAGDLSVLRNGRLRTAGAMYRSFAARGKVSRSNPRIGDIVAWGYGSRITHVGLYIGGGKAVSTLTSGVRIHGIQAVTAPFKGYLHTGMSARRTPVGWAHAHEVSTSLQAADTGGDTAAARVVDEGDVVTTIGWTNVRKSAGTSGALVALYKRGTTLTVIGHGTDSVGRTWLKVRRGDLVGYVAQWVTAG